MSKDQCTHEHKHGEHCHCGHEHEHHHEHHHEHEEHCCCGHDHEHHHGHMHSHHGCGCGCHEEGEEEAALLIPRIIISAVLFVLGIISEHIPYENSAVISVIVFAAAYIAIGYDVIWRSVRNIAKGHIFDENLLMTVASIGAFLVGEHPEGVAVMLLYQFGEMLQDRAVDKSERSIETLLDVRATAANVERDGQVLTVAPEQVSPGELVIVKNGEKIPLDGIIREGTSQLDQSALTGESVPVTVKQGDEIMGGSVNKGGVLKIEVTKAYEESAVSKILEFVQQSRDKKPKAEKFISKFAKYYTPVVVILALIVMFIPPIFTHNWMEWIRRGLVFLVVSCPCALVISIPLGFFSAMGAASKNGILIKGGEYIEWLAKLDAAVFDKTGTLTKGVFNVTEITGDAENALELAAYCENYSNHPIAGAIMEAYGKTPELSRISEYVEEPGMGVRARVDGAEVLAGNNSLMKKYGISFNDNGAQVHVAKDGVYIGSITISDEVRQDAKTAVDYFKKNGIKTVMLTGDRKEPAEKIAGELGIDIVKYGLLPTEKAEEFAKIQGIKAFTGDGINDAPVLSAAHVGFAMGGMGSDSAVETADAVILTDEPSKTAVACRISKRAMFIIKENIVFSIAVKLLAMILSFAGVSNIMWFAIFADVGTAMIAIANSMRILYSGIKIKW